MANVKKDNIRIENVPAFQKLHYEDNAFHRLLADCMLLRTIVGKINQNKYVFLTRIILVTSAVSHELGLATPLH